MQLTPLRVRKIGAFLKWRIGSGVGSDLLVAAQLMGRPFGRQPIIPVPIFSAI
jgi:hypothetical protein